MSQAIKPSLWFEERMEEALDFYCEVFPNSEVRDKAYMPEGGMAPAGTLLSANFVLNGVEFSAINGGPMFTFNESISFEVPVETQEEVDYYWDRLTSDGGEESQCGWLKDKFGLSWQIVPTILYELMADADSERASRAMKAMLQMQKLDIAALTAAADGAS